MRMRDLSERSGVSATTIHHYLREGLLPPAEKTARNAAVYDATHLKRLRLIRDLRSRETDPYSLPAIRRVVARVEQGFNSSAAAALERLAGEVEEEGPFDMAGLASTAGADLETIERLIAAGLIVPSAESRSYDAADLAVARACAELFATTTLEPDDLAPVAELLVEVARYEHTLMGLVDAQDDAPEEVGDRLARLLGELHTYLFARLSRDGVRRSASAEGRP